MSGWREAADEAIAHNIADVPENGPRLAWGRKTAPVAIDRQNKRVLQTGLGCMGVGTMWVGYHDEPAEWADLPEQDSAGQFGASHFDADVRDLKRSFVRTGDWGNGQAEADRG